MALSKVLKQIYHNATDEVIRRGKRIFHTGGVQLVDNDPITETATFKVKNDIYYNQYKVQIKNYGVKKRIFTRCDCPYNMGVVCKHEAAALFQLNDLMESGFLDNVEMSFDQKDTTVRMRQITRHFLKLFSNSNIYHKASVLKETKGAVSIDEAEKDTVRATVKEGKKTFPIILRQNEDRYFDTSCTCDETEHPLCVHKVAAFLRLFDERGSHYFSTIRDWEAQKDKLLKLYGFSLEDDLTGKFEFHFHEGKLFLRVLNPSIKKLSQRPQGSLAKKKEKEKNVNLHYGVVLEEKGSHFPFTTFQLISGETDEKNEKFVRNTKRCAPERYISSSDMPAQERALTSAIRKLSSEEALSKHIKRNSPFGSFLDHLSDKLKTEHPSKDLRDQAWDFYLPRYQSLLQRFHDFALTYYLPRGASFSRKSFEPLTFCPNDFNLSVKVQHNKNGDVTLRRRFRVEETLLPVKGTYLINDGLIKNGNRVIAAATINTVQFMEEFEGEAKKIIKADDWPDYLENVLLPFSKESFVEFDDDIIKKVSEEEPDLRLYLRETEKYIIFKPCFIYHSDAEREWLDNQPVIWAEDGLLKTQQRDVAAEQTFLNLLRYAHEEMKESRKSASFMLPAKEAVKGNWYFNFMNKLKESKVEILGYNKLRKHKISPHKPKTSLNITTGIDWFDTKIDLKFGDEKVTIASVKKALSKNQNFVRLRDGSMAILPEEWMDKYALMVRMGTLNGSDNIRLKKIHFSALENVEEDIEEDNVRKEMAERREKILSIESGKSQTIPVPENVDAELRPYQKAGIQWLNFLNETGWGGILADDMGLGKTIQSLAYLQHYLNKNKDAFFLIVCPTTIIYNWENEIKQFTPDIKYKIHHGTSRSSSPQDLRASGNLLITTYGTLRSDIKMLSEMAFDYVVLDESQAIKNPNSQVAKASLLLNSKHRIALSGTPVQNNTFDLFAQMHFLNPGLLGSKEFFRREFAVPIDKNQQKESRENLKRLINPFLLRRTKEQVATDLPTKTETTIFCEMGQKQKRVYNAYRNSFRTKILGEIDEKGLGRTKMSVLTGLMKLRQICDSPAILKGEDEDFGNHSVKVNELVRELTENTGQHKALVFSQFLGMLALIRAELERLNIPYAYFDGSTSTKEREKAVQQFQKEEDCRVFLISLKAGGVGLNLTAADYVYIVDPWWNPTVEQQAIDRTHRIGQTKKILAYRLICKDSIEEKIIQLQHRKLNLANELIGDENAFIKKLNREDIEFLLS